VVNTLTMIKQWLKEQIAEYQKMNRVKMNGYDPYELVYT